LAAAPAQGEDQAKAQRSEDPLLLEAVLKETPPVALVKDDEPFDEATGAGLVDRFGTSEIAKRLAGIVEQMEPPYTISLSGPWGVGKTWVAKRLKTVLRAAVAVVEVDLWTEDIDLLRRTLAVEVAVRLTGETNEEQLRKDAEKKAKQLDHDLRRPEVEPTTPRFTAPGLKSRWSVMTAVVALILTALVYLAISQPAVPPGSSPAPWVSPIIAGAFGALIWLVLHSGLVLSVSQPGSTLPPVREAVALRNEFRTLVTGASRDRKVLVVLDNLDRLTGDDAVRALGEVRSFVDLPKSRCIFLVPLDRAALERHLERTMGGDAQGARDYLDKFFNLDLVLTNPAPADLRDSILGLLTVLFPGVASRQLSTVAEIVAEAAGGSPRAAKRIANGVYARSYLLPSDARGRITLLDVAFVECLLSRFPHVIPQLTQELERSLRRVTEVRRLSDPDERLPHLLDLLGEPVSPTGEEKQPVSPKEQQRRQVRALDDFLRVTRAVSPPPDIVRTVLTVRSDRQFGRLPDPQRAGSALRAGDSEALRKALEASHGDDRHAALGALLDDVRVNLSDRWPTGARSGLNALCPLLNDDPEHAATLRVVAADYLLQADTDDFRSLEPTTISFLFPNGGRGFPHVSKIADRATTALTPARPSRLSTANAVRFVAATAYALPAKKLDETKATLAKLQDNDLGPLYEDGADPRLLPGPVCDMYVARLADLDATSDLPTLELAADRLRFAQVKAKWDGAAALDPVFARVNGRIQTGEVTEAAMPLFERLVALTEPTEPHTETDTFAERLATFTPGGLRALELALTVPTSPGSIEPAITAQMTGMSGPAFLEFAGAQRRLLDARGIGVAAMATTRWAAGNGKEYLDVAIVADEAPQFDAVFAGLQAVADAATYIGLLDGLADRALSLGSKYAAGRLIADIAGRMPSLTHDLMGSSAEVVAKIQRLADAAPVVSAAAAALGVAARLEIPAATAVAKNFVEAGVKGAHDLPRVVVEHAAAEGTIDLDNVNWLLEQSAVSGENVILGFRMAIKDAPQGKVRAVLDDLPKTRRRRRDLGKALVERAASEPSGSRVPWLEDALESGTPSRKHNRNEHDEYEDALNRAVEGDAATDQIVRRLRGKL
jgi:hypothetical protein